MDNQNVKGIQDILSKLKDLEKSISNLSKGSKNTDKVGDKRTHYFAFGTSDDIVLDEPIDDAVDTTENNIGDMMDITEDVKPKLKVGFIRKFNGHRFATNNPARIEYYVNDNNEINGKFKIYKNNSYDILIKGKMINGVLFGKYEEFTALVNPYFYKDNKLYKTVTYCGGKVMISTRYDYKSGLIYVERVCKDMTTQRDYTHQWAKYMSNGNNKYSKISASFYNIGDRLQEIEYFENGKPEKIINYTINKFGDKNRKVLDGLQTEFYSNGNYRRINMYKNGTLCDIEHTFHNNGQLMMDRDVLYNGAMKSYSKTYDIYGNLISDITKKNGMMKNNYSDELKQYQ